MCIVESRQMVVQMRWERNNWLELQTICWKSAENEIANWQKSFFCSYPSQRWHRRTTNNVFVLSKVAGNLSIEEIFTSTGVTGMLEWYNYAAVDIDFLFLAAFLNHAIGCRDIPALTKVHLLYWDIVNQLLFTKSRGENQCFGDGFISEDIRRLNILAKHLFEELKHFNLFTFEFTNPTSFKKTNLCMVLLLFKRRLLLSILTTLSTVS